MAELPFQIEEIAQVCDKNDVAMLGIFGSVARGEANEQSDIDLLVRFSERKSLLALIRLERELAQALGKEVDLQTEAGLSPYLRERILRDLKVIYGTR